jgi:hypothetical protein
MFGERAPKKIIIEKGVWCGGIVRTVKKKLKYVNTSHLALSLYQGLNPGKISCRMDFTLKKFLLYIRVIALEEMVGNIGSKS